MASLRKAIRTGWRPGGVYRLATTVGPVRYRVVRADPVAYGAVPALVIGLHGFGSDEQQVATMLALDVPSPIVYLAPRAPKPEGSGFSWFDLRVGLTGRPRPDAGAIDTVLVRLHAFADAAQRAWRTDPKRTVLIGYSQGGTLALAAALHDTGPFQAIASLAGSLGYNKRGLPRAPLFVGVGILDPFVDLLATQHHIASWRASGKEVVLSEAEAGHVVTAQHRTELAAWLSSHLGLPF